MVWASPCTKSCLVLADKILVRGLVVGKVVIARDQIGVRVFLWGLWVTVWGGVVFRTTVVFLRGCGDNVVF